MTRIDCASMACILLDVDGVLHVSGEAIQGAQDAVARLRDAGHALRFVTNNSTRPRAQLTEELSRLGFEVEEFGGGSLRVSAFPSLLTREDCDVALRALADDLEGLDRGSKVEDAIKRIAATMACHAAVKANYPLTMEKMAHILEELRRTAYSTICPHGRPVMLRLTRREVEKNFQRI